MGEPTTLARNPFNSRNAHGRQAQRCPSGRRVGAPQLGARGTMLVGRSSSGAAWDGISPCRRVRTWVTHAAGRELRRRVGSGGPPSVPPCERAGDGREEAPMLAASATRGTSFSKANVMNLGPRFREEKVESRPRREESAAFERPVRRSTLYFLPSPLYSPLANRDGGI